MSQVKFELYPFQATLLDSLKRYGVTTMAISRRAGKSHICGLASFLHCIKAPQNGTKPRRVLIIAPTADMARDSHWDNLNELAYVSYKHYIKEVKKQEKTIVFKNGSIINLRSADKQHTLRGLSAKAKVSLVILDEAAFVRDGKILFEQVLAPYMADRDANCKFLITSTPQGVNSWFYEIFQQGKSPNFPNYNSIHYTCYEARPDLKEFYDEQKKMMSAKAFASEYMADFTTSGNQAFYNMSDKNINKTIKDVQPNEGVVIALDANYGINSHLICRVKELPTHNEIEIIKAIQGKHKNITQFVADYQEKYVKNMGCNITICPDASMTQKSYAASIGQTGMSLLRDAGWKVLVDKANPSHLDSVEAVNNLLLTPTGVRALTVNHTCVAVIDALKAASWKQDEGHKLAKSTYSKGSHIQDTIRYLCWQFRQRFNKITIKRKKWF